MNMIPDIVFPANTWVNVYALTGFPVGSALLIVNKLKAFDALIWEGPTKPADTSQDGMPLQYPRGLMISEGASGCWAFYPGNSSAVPARLCVQRV
jgi:hypothetical protein